MSTVFYKLASFRHRQIGTRLAVLTSSVVRPNKDQKMVENILELAPSIVASLAWPVTAIVIVCLLRRNLRQLIDRLERAETKLGNFIFSKALFDLKEGLDKIEGSDTTDKSFEETEKPDNKELYAPVAEVMSAWDDVEGLCQRLLAKRGLKTPKPYRPLGLSLKRNQLIDSEHSVILDKLRQVRNIAVHGAPDTVSSREAQEYVVLAGRMVTYLDGQIAGE